MFEKRKRQKAAKRRLNEAIAGEWAARGVVPTGPGPQPFREALRKAGLPDVGSSEYTRIVCEVMEDAVSSLSSEDRALVTRSSAARSEAESTEEATPRDEYPVMTQLLGESFLNEWKTSLIRERERRQAIEDELKRQIMIDLADRPEEWAAELDRRMARLYEDEDHEEGRATEEGRIRMSAVTAEERLDDEQIELAAAVELLTGADDRVDLYGMSEEEADLYLSAHYLQVVAHDTLRLSVLMSLIEQGGAEEIAGGYVRFTDDDAVALLRKMARGRSLNPLRSLRPHRHFAKALLREWKDAGKVRLSVLSLMPSPPVAEAYRGQAASAMNLGHSGAEAEARQVLDEKAYYIGQHIINAGLAERCEVDLAYVDGTRLVLVAIHTFGTEMIPVPRIEQVAREWLLGDA